MAPVASAQGKNIFVVIMSIFLSLQISSGWLALPQLFDELVYSAFVSLQGWQKWLHMELKPQPFASFLKNCVAQCKIISWLFFNFQPFKHVVPQLSALHCFWWSYWVPLYMIRFYSFVCFSCFQDFIFIFIASLIEYDVSPCGSLSLYPT